MMAKLDDLPAIKWLVTAEEWQGRTPTYCHWCPFSSPDREKDYIGNYGEVIPGSINRADPAEGYYVCALLQRKAVWGESPQCELADWQQRAILELARCGAVEPEANV